MHLLPLTPTGKDAPAASHPNGKEAPAASLTSRGRTHLLAWPLALLLLKPPVASVGHRSLLGAALGRMGGRHIERRGGASIGLGGEGLGVELR